MTAHSRTSLLLSSAIPLLCAHSARSDCALFHDSLDGVPSIVVNGGVISGSVGFVPGVNDDAASFNGSGSVTYSSGLFAAEAGSFAFWFRKSSSDAEGGILQAGALGQPRSFGVFYVNQADLVFEARNDSSALVQISASGALSQTEWTHVVVSWRNRGDGGCDHWLFVNGQFVTHGYLPAAFVHTAQTLQIGVTDYYGNAHGVMDELRFFDWKLLDSEVYAESVYSSNRHRRQPSAKPVSTGSVQVIGKTLFVDGEPFRVKGVGYAPTPIGYWPGQYPVYTDAAILARDVALLEGMNVNTIRTWAQPPNDTLLDAMYFLPSEPIRVIIGFWVPTNGMDDYGDPATVTFYEGRFRDLVNQFKDHPAVLAWGIGNELNISLSGQDLADWYALANRLAEVAYEAEGAAYHPTIVVNGGLWGLGSVDFNSDDVSMDFVDMWGQNTYFGYDAHCFFDYYHRLSAKPLIFTEYGIDACDNATGGEYQAVQADYVVRQWRQIESGCVGGTIMAYSDEWWKADSPTTHDLGGYGTDNHPDGFSNEEWWGMVAVQDNGSAPDILHPRQVYYDLGQEYAYDAFDADGDGDVDLMDFAAFQTCVGADSASVCGTLFDSVVDGVIDRNDHVPLAACLRGPDQPPVCAE